MTSTVRRAAAVAGLCTLSLAVPGLGPRYAAPIAVVLLAAAVLVTDGALFELLALPGDYEDGRLYSLLSFVLAATLLGVIAATSSMSVAVFVGTVFLVGYGDLAEQLARLRTEERAVAAAAFCAGGAIAAVAGATIARWLGGDGVAALRDTLPAMIFLAASGALLAALLRDVLFQYDDPLVLLVVGPLGWLLSELDPVEAVAGTELVLAVAVTVALGYLSYRLETASVAGMLAGVLLTLLTIVLGGWGWFVVLIAFFGIGGLSTKFRYEEKAARGVAEENDGARGSANVFSNAAVALGAVVGHAGSDVSLVGIDPVVFTFAFAGAVATALADTLSSEIGGVYDHPRLITTLEAVDPGTDGAITWQGELAGVAGALIVAAAAFALLPAVGAAGAAVVVLAGVIGMTVDSLLGATIEGSTVGNQAVNFLATLSGAIVAGLVAFGL